MNSYIAYNPLYLQVKDVLLKRIVDDDLHPKKWTRSQATLYNSFCLSN
jgi:hypothetical protein